MVSCGMRSACGVGKAVGLLVFAALTAAMSPSLCAQSQRTNVSGRYQCAEAKVAGKIVPCTGSPLILKSDGHFALQGWEGSYMVEGDWVELWDSAVRSRARIAQGHKIVFRYRGKHGWCEMVYQRRIAELGNTSLT